MKKIFLLAAICLGAFQSNAQFNYTYTDESIPVTGVQYGVVGGGHTAMFFNRDDMDAEFVKPQMMNFTYFGGVERIRWYVPHFGVGLQATLWNAGAKYKGTLGPDDTFPTIEAKTSLAYVKIPALFYYKSYSRWHPDRRLRVNTFFGPYIAMLVDGKEEWSTTIPGVEGTQDYKLKSGSYLGRRSTDTADFFNGNADDTQPFKTVDYGFVMGAGVEIRLWRRTVVALTLRADLGVAEVENKDFSVDAADGTRYRFYKDVTGKFNPYSGALPADYDYNRPETNNFSVGAQLSIRKYFGAK